MFSWLWLFFVAGHLGKDAFPAVAARSNFRERSISEGSGQSARANFPGDRHTLDENASKTEPAKLLAVFVVNTDEKELLTPLKK